ncbi:HEAT repeat domain-containing protein [bacterium]|nr:HEAT repeat domain-containing protein [bacterium]
MKMKTKIVLSILLIAILICTGLFIFSLTPKNTPFNEEIEEKKAECDENQYCLLAVARLNKNPEICQEILDEKIKSECLIYTAGYSEEELKQVLLKNDLNLNSNARIFGLRELTGISCQNVQFLLEIMRDDDAAIRLKAIQIMGENECSSVKLALNEKNVTNRITEVYIMEPDIHVKAMIIQTLGKLGDNKTIPFIEKTLRNNQTSKFIKISCLGALGDIGGDKSLAILNEYKDNSNELLKINARRSINKVTECVEKEDSYCLPLDAEKYDDIDSCPPSNQDNGYCIRRVAENTNNLDLCYEAGNSKDLCINSIARLRKSAALCYEAGTYKEQCLEWCSYTYIPYTGAPSETNCNPPK